jgi:L-ribulose-5-phosphate 3-epimerase UlaE
MTAKNDFRSDPNYRGLQSFNENNNFENNDKNSTQMSNNSKKKLLIEEMTKIFIKLIIKMKALIKLMINSKYLNLMKIIAKNYFPIL